MIKAFVIAIVLASIPVPKPPAPCWYCAEEGYSVCYGEHDESDI